MLLSEVPTPAIVIDEAIALANLKRMASYATEHGLQLRPHTKTHKSQFVGRLQMELGACGLTVAKAGEAEVMAEVCSDIFVAYPTVDPYRCKKLAELARRIRISVGLDSSFCAMHLSEAAAEADSLIDVLIDLDVGYGRTGVRTVDAAIELAEKVMQLPNLRLKGLMVYSGHIMGSGMEQAEAFAGVEAIVGQARQEWLTRDLPLEVISGGSTPSAYHSHFAPSITEIRPGTYVYNDMNIVHGGYGKLADCAARIYATVVSDNQKHQVVLDAGSKALTSDLCGPKPDSGHGYVVEYPKAKIVKLTEEHAQVDISRCKEKPALGERVSIIPNHICPCINLQDHIWWLQEDQTVRQEPIHARGLVC